jgi:riboflavin synthase
MENKMFTGIIESFGTIENMTSNQNGVSLTIKAKDIVSELQVDDSVAINGICLTVVAILDNSFKVDIVQETLDRSACKNWSRGQKVNLERGMPANGRLDGHIVQGHIDGTAELISFKKRGDSSEMIFKTDKTITDLMVEKGSVALDGVSLTIADVQDREFKIAVIPYTLANTLLGKIKRGDIVNVETDILGKYIAKFMKDKKTLDRSTLLSWGYQV